MTARHAAADRLMTFGHCRFDAHTGQLWRNRCEAKLTPRAAAVLSLLVEHAGQVVTKQMFTDQVRDGLAVSDDALTSCIHELRHALGDDARKPHYIETRHRRGYRLKTPVVTAPEAGPPTGQRPIGGDIIAPASTAPADVPLALLDKPSLAVLPFQNMSGDPEQEYFVDGLVDDIITALSRTRALFVIARNSSFSYKGKSPDVRQVGRQLGVRYVLEGSVRKAGTKVRITGQLVDAQSGAHIWAERFDGDLADIFALQDEIASRSVIAIVPNLERTEIERRSSVPTGNLAAYDCSLRGWACIGQYTREATDEALSYFQRAMELDPNFALAWAPAGICYVQRKAWRWAADPGTRGEGSRTPGAQGTRSGS